MTLEYWSALMGFFLPALVAVVNRESWNPWAKSVVALAISALGGTITALLSGDLTGSSWVQSVGVAFAASQVFYHAWWKNSEIADWIERRVNLFRGSEPALGGAPGESGSGRHSLDAPDAD